MVYIFYNFNNIQDNKPNITYEAFVDIYNQNINYEQISDKTFLLIPLIT